MERIVAFAFYNECYRKTFWTTQNLILLPLILIIRCYLVLKYIYDNILNIVNLRLEDVNYSIYGLVDIRNENLPRPIRMFLAAKSPCIICFLDKYRIPFAMLYAHCIRSRLLRSGVSVEPFILSNKAASFLIRNVFMSPVNGFYKDNS